MAGFIEKTEGYLFKYGDGGQIGRRIFVEKSGGNKSLPSIGSNFPFPRAIAVANTLSCLLRDITVVQYGDHPAINHYTCEYSSEARDDSEIENITLGQNVPTGLQMSGEFISVKSDGSWKWASDDEVIDTDIPINKRITTGSLTMERVDRKVDLDQIGVIVGKLNASAFPAVQGLPSYPAGIWLCHGINAEPFTNEKGDVRWRLRPTFLFRSVTGTPSDGKGWNYAWRPDTAKWDLPVGTAGDINAKNIYDPGNFNNLFR